MPEDTDKKESFSTLELIERNEERNEERKAESHAKLRLSSAAFIIPAFFQTLASSPLLLSALGTLSGFCGLIIINNARKEIKFAKSLYRSSNQSQRQKLNLALAVSLASIRGFTGVLALVAGTVSLLCASGLIAATSPYWLAATYLAASLFLVVTDFVKLAQAIKTRYHASKEPEDIRSCNAAVLKASLQLLADLLLVSAFIKLIAPAIPLLAPVFNAAKTYLIATTVFLIHLTHKNWEMIRLSITKPSIAANIYTKKDHNNNPSSLCYRIIKLIVDSICNIDVILLAGIYQLFIKPFTKPDESDQIKITSKESTFPDSETDSPGSSRSSLWGSRRNSGSELRLDSSTPTG